MIQLNVEPDLITGCKNKQPQAQELLYRRCYPLFMKICLRYSRSYDDAANVLQESFIKIFLRIHTYSGKGDFIGWMKKIVVNTALDHLRKDKLHEHVTMPEIPDVADSELMQESKYVVDEKQLLGLIRQLPKMQSVVFNLFVMENYSHQDIANELSITVALSKWYLFDARKQLQKKLALYVND